MFASQNTFLVEEGVCGVSFLPLSRSFLLHRRTDEEFCGQCLERRQKYDDNTDLEQPYDDNNSATTVAVAVAAWATQRCEGGTCAQQTMPDVVAAAHTHTHTSIIPPAHTNAQTQYQ